MTTEGQAGSAQEMATPPAVAAQDVTADTTVSAPPDDPQELREEIERTREQLGETVQALAAKADVKARAQDKAAQVTVCMKTKAGQARRQAAAKVGQVQSQLRQHRAPLAVGIGAGVLSWLVIGWRRRR
jgi:Protein of unknown function (DUF3618)